MDATTDRRNRKITFDGRKIGVYEPTDGQLAMIGMTLSGGGASGKDLKRLLQIMQALCVDPAEWARTEEGLIDGRLDTPDLIRFLKQMFDHEWAPRPKATKAQRTARKTAAAEPELPDEDEDDDE